jgi:hypothetical protein
VAKARILPLLGGQTRALGRVLLFEAIKALISSILSFTFLLQASMALTASVRKQ